jgi:hypothetical protein
MIFCGMTLSPERGAPWRLAGLPSISKRPIRRGAFMRVARSGLAAQTRLPQIGRGIGRNEPIKWLDENTA